MKKTILSVCSCLLAGLSVHAQITITASDMPVGPAGGAPYGDTLRYSTTLPTGSLNLANTGANISWDYSLLRPLVQTVDTYKTASAAGYTGGGISATAFGYKIADSFPGSPVPVKDIYTFFNVKPSLTATPNRFVAEGFGAKVNGVLPIPGGYSNEDTIYNFPLTYNRSDNSTFKLTVNVTLLGASLKQQGMRKTTVDGWGTLTTPFVANLPVLRVRSEVDEIDSITFAGNTIGLPRHIAEYKWLANGQHGPVLQINTVIVGTTETPTSVRYRDTKRNLLGVGGPSKAIEALQVYPNPAAGNEVTVKIPALWNYYRLHVYDAAGRLLSETVNQSKISTASLPSGVYTVIAECNGMYGAAQFVK